MQRTVRSDGSKMERGLRKLHIDLGVPNPLLVIETMATCELSKGQGSGEKEKGSRTEL